MRLVNFILDGRVCNVDIFKGRVIGRIKCTLDNDLNVIHEFKANGKTDINFFKQITGGDNLQISKLFKEPKTYAHDEYAKSVLTANDVNDLIEDVDNATLRRLSTFILTVKFILDLKKSRYSCIVKIKVISEDTSYLRPFAIKTILILGRKTSIVLIFKNPAKKKQRLKYILKQYYFRGHH